MKRQHLVSALLLTLVAGAASAHYPASRSVPAERLVGAWRVDVAIGPCHLPQPVAFFSAFNTFHSGGTLSDSNWAPAGSRGPGHGTWRYTGKRQFESGFRFFRYDNPQPGQASGIQEVKVRITLDADGEGYIGTVNAQQTDLDGNPAGPPLCGQAVGTRLGL
jgi:hypothetical protein